MSGVIRAMSEPLSRAQLDACQPGGLSVEAVFGGVNNPVRRSVSCVSFSVIRDSETVGALRNEWARLFDEAGTDTQLFQSSSWCLDWWEAMTALIENPDKQENLCIVTGRISDRLVFVWPLVEARVLGVRCLTWLGLPISQYGDVLVAKDLVADAVLQAASEYLREQKIGDVLDLPRVRNNASIANWLARSRAIWLGDETALSVNLHGVLEDLRLSSPWGGLGKRRKNRRRQRRRLEEAGDVVFEHCSNAKDSRETLKQALSLKRRWLRDRGVLSRGLSHPAVQSFFELVCDRVPTDLRMHVFRLTCGGRTASCAIAFGCKGRLAVHIIAYDRDYAYAAGGALLCEDIVVWARANGFHTVDLMAPGDRYKLEWCRERTRVSLWMVPISWKGWLFAYYRKLLPWDRTAKSILARLPLPVRRTVIGRVGLA